MIDCVTKDETKDAFARILAVGGPNLPGVSPPDTSKLASRLRRRGLHIAEKARWTLTIEEAIDGILAGKWTFYIHVGAYNSVNVQVATSPSGRRYLKTELDQDTPDELLFLPQCW
jgi:hypothetical protein